MPTKITPQLTNGTDSASDFNLEEHDTRHSSDHSAQPRMRPTNSLFSGLSNKILSSDLSNTRYDRPSKAELCDVHPCSGDLGSPRSSGITAEDMAPFRALERTYANLFATTEIGYIDNPSSIRLGNVKDVDMDECAVINASRSQFGAIGTKGVATCIAVCARGKNHQDEDILALHHYSGLEEAEDVLEDISKRMRRHGVSNPKFYLVGGTIMPEERESGSIDLERDLLSLASKYNIQGAKLHLCIGEFDRAGETNMVSVAMTPQNIFYRKDSLY